MNTILKLERSLVQWLCRHFQRHILRVAVRSAYTSFAKQHPQWRASLFDEYFVLNHLLPLLESAICEAIVVTPYQVALLWAQQMSALPTQRIENTATMLPAAIHFLALLQDALAANNQLLHTETFLCLQQGSRPGPHAPVLQIG